VNDAATVSEDSGATAIAVLANDTDPDGGPKSIVDKTNSAHGTVAITGGGSGLTYQPGANYCNSPPGTSLDTFTYTLNRGSTATVTMTVTCVEDNPTAVNDAATVLEDSGGTAIDVLANDTDPDGGPKAIVAKTDPANGTVVVTGAGSGLTYQPNANYCNNPPGTPDKFTYTLNGGSTATVSVTVTCVDDAPVAVNDTATVNEDAGATAIDVFANDTDIDGGPKTITATTSATHGTVAITGGGTGLTYSPDPDYCNSPPGTSLDSFTYTLNGGSTATVTVTVTCVDDAPVAVDDTATLTEDAGATAIDVLANDTDVDGGPKTITAKTDGSNGTVVITGGGSGLTYQPAANFCGSDSFTYTLNGGSTATVDVTVTCVDDPPTAVNDAGTIDEDAGATAVDVLANDTDPDGGLMSITAKTDGTNGTVVITGGGSGLTYTPAANFCGSDTFTYTLNGGSSATVAMTVTCVNDAPSFSKGPNQSNVANQNADGSARAYTVDPWATAISPGPANESGQTVDFVIDSVTPSNLFTVQPAVSASGALTFTTDPARTGTATIVLHLHDNGGTLNGGVDSSATQSFTIQTVNPPPVAVNDSYTATGNVGINVNDTAEGVLQRGTDDTLFGATITNCGSTSAASTAVSGGSCTTASASGGSAVLSANGTFTYDPAAGFTGSDHFFYKLTNSGGSSVGDVSITVGGMIWFVKNDAAACTTLASNCGRLSKPFSSLAAFQAVNGGAAPNPQNGNTIFLYTGSGAYTGGVTLSDGQLLIGQGAGASITTISGITLAPFSNPLPATGGTRPSLTTTTAATNAITLGSGNTVRGLDIGNRTGSGIAGSNFGTLTLSEVDITGTGQALNLNTGTANASFGAVSSSSGTNGVALTSASGSLTATGGTLTGSTGDELLISGGNGSFTYPGAITNTGTNKAVNINGKSGGTIALSGQITDTGGTGGGISLTTNSGATINLTSGIFLSTGTTAAFTATGGGTLNVTGSTNTLTTTTATALNVANTTIGSSGLTIRSITAGTAASGPANGIVLNNTGSSGGLTVTGTGSAGSGGTIQNSTSFGISLASTKSPSFSWMNVQNGGDDGINGASVNGFTLANSNVSGNGNAVNESAVDFTGGLTGTASITNSTLTGSAENGLIVTDASGSLNLTATGSTFSNTSTLTGNDGIHLDANDTAAITASVTGSTFNNNRGDHFQFSTNATSSGTNSVTFSNNTLTGVAGNLGAGITISTDASSHTSFALSNNNIQGAVSSAIAVDLGTNSTAAGTLSGTISGNTIGTAAVVDSGSSQFNGITTYVEGNGTLTETITGNTVRQYANFAGIDVRVRAGSPTLNATITSNTIANPGTFATNGLFVQGGAATTDGGTICAAMSANSITGSSANGATDFRLRQRFNTTIRLPGYAGAAGDTAAVVAFVQSNNGGTPTGSATVAFPTTGGGFVGGAACPTP
jgi:VCBS repeat-containing protein